MAETGTTNAGGDKAVVAEPRSAAISAAGVKTGEQFAGLMSALMSDVIEGRLTPSVSNAAVNAGGKLLKVVEMQYKYGSTQEDKRPSLLLAP